LSFQVRERKSRSSCGAYPGPKMHSKKALVLKVFGKHTQHHISAVWLPGRGNVLKNRSSEALARPDARSCHEVLPAQRIESSCEKLVLTYTPVSKATALAQHVQRLLSAFDPFTGRVQPRRHRLHVQEDRVLFQRRFQVWKKASGSKHAVSLLLP